MKIAVPIHAATQKEALRKMREAAKQGDVLELWPQKIRDLNLPALLKARLRPVIVTSQKSDLLAAADLWKAEFICIGWPLSEKLNKKFTHSRVILAYHDFKKTPPLKELYLMAREMKQDGADIVKIATQARSPEDALRHIVLADMLREKGIPHILIAMGQKGILSRILTPTLGGTFMFAPLKASQATAPGQPPVAELRKAWGNLSKETLMN